jgi:uncharacterized protein YjdB
VSLAVAPTTATLAVGDTMTPAAVYGAPACEASRLAPTWTWTSSDATVASVDERSGLVRARTVGTATILAKVVGGAAAGAMTVSVLFR